MADKVEKVKKRKRHIDDSSKPSKRVAIDEDKQISVSLLETGKWAPVLASTPGLAMPSEINLRAYTKMRRNAPSRVGKSGDIATKELILHSSDHSKLDYTAREEEVGGVDSLLKHYIGVYDPETGKMEVVEARKMIVRGSVRAHQATKEDDLSMNMRERRNELGQTFGTKKARKAIASVTENAISPDKSLRMLANGQAPKLDGASAAIIASMAKATKGMSTRDDLSKAADDAKPRPKANLDATDVADVYTVDSLIGEDTMMLIPVRLWQEAIRKNKEIVISSSYVANRIGRTKYDNIEKLKILRYMLLLIDVYNNCTIMRGQRKLPNPRTLREVIGDMPEAVLEGVKRNFTEGGLMSKYKSDLLITHLCAMACLVDNFEVDMWDLKEDLKLEMKPMAQYFNEIGARNGALGVAEKQRLGLDKAAAAQRKVAKLKLPLDFPKVGFGRRR
ncbi:RNA polymerase I associated factor, A49-like protein [Mollisia scopiformis]|uniref:RNA polymerase I associated factor, A49-like protein n=1 Tax=Mollisia scopiformis TaxID=149040 RepID=A0A194XID1_MOLSC|nr:RNA polymerase I associated factor, A49-like protein [Mollisia scopiformis]KUJ19884.1 RNA polymerase I associated factor, A49-like protein [Mollisia scopiformis]